MIAVITCLRACPGPAAVGASQQEEACAAPSPARTKRVTFARPDPTRIFASILSDHSPQRTSGAHHNARPGLHRSPVGQESSKKHTLKLLAVPDPHLDHQRSPGSGGFTFVPS